MPPARARHSSQPRQSVAATAIAILKEGTRLVITEGRLLRTELAEKVGVVGIGLALTVGGAVLLMMALVVLFVAAIGALIEAGFSLTVAALIVSAALLVLGAGSLWFGVRQLQPTNLMPKRTIEQVQKDLESITPETA